MKKLIKITVNPEKSREYWKENNNPEDINIEITWENLRGI